MSAAITTTATTRPPLRATLASEWTKLWAVPSTWGLIIVTGVLTIGITAVITLFGGGGALSAQQGESNYQIIFYGSSLGVFAYAFLAAGFMAHEYRTGMMAYTMTATNRPWRVLVSKLIIIGILGYVSGLVISLINFVITQGTLSAAGYAALNLGDPSLLRAVLLFTGLGMAVQGLLSCMLTVAFRNATAAVITIIMVNTLPVVTAQFLGEAYATTVPRFLPGALLESVSGLSIPGSAGYLPGGPAVLALGVWIAAFLCGSVMIMNRRDV